MTDGPAPPLVWLIAGEPSGDLLGARLMAALKKKTNGMIRFAGIGGPRMVAEGLELFFPQDELAHMGLLEVLRHLPRLFRLIRRTIAEVARRKPAALVTIDSPDFCFRVARKLKGQGVPLIHYVAPTVWAWRPGRARKIARFLDHLMALLPFEPPYFTREGLACTFVGHPLVESDAGKGDARRFRERYALPADAPLLACLPGSRRREVASLLPRFGAVVAQLKTTHPRLHVTIPAVENVRDAIREAVKDWPVPVILTEGDADKYDSFAAATAALACSGSVTIELTMARLPAVVAYRVNPFTAALLRRFVKVRYATLANIMHDRMVVRECLQDNCTPEKLAESVEDILLHPEARARQLAALADVASWLGQGQFIPSERAAETVLSILHASPRDSSC